MKNGRFSDAQIMAVLKQAEGGSTRNAVNVGVDVWDFGERRRLLKFFFDGKLRYQKWC